MSVFDKKFENEKSNRRQYKRTTKNIYQKLLTKQFYKQEKQRK